MTVVRIQNARDILLAAVENVADLALGRKRGVSSLFAFKLVKVVRFIDECLRLLRVVYTKTGPVSKNGARKSVSELDIEEVKRSYLRRRTP